MTWTHATAKCCESDFRLSGSLRQAIGPFIPVARRIIAGIRPLALLTSDLQD